ncbi:MAG: Clp protease N-terminal domain-containing protein, partial [Patescibacteria group bacterium]|nr:Clp protease N-terminal domain-containing protein [Patescibacteria group bacterium]
MPPFNHFTTKAKEAVRRAHELAVERGQNQVSPTHLLGALLLQEESLVASVLDKLDVDVVLLTDTVLEALEGVAGSSVLSPSYQLYLTPDLVQALERSAKVATELHDEFVSTEHLFISLFDVAGSVREILAR